MMKKLLLLLLVLPFVASDAPKVPKTEKAAKAAAEMKAFQAICELVNSKQFQIEVDKVYPQDGFDVSRFNPEGKIIVTDSIAKGNLPFFGRAYSLPYGEGGGIEFDERMKKVKIQLIHKRKKRAIMFDFSIPGQKDQYQISIEAMPNGRCTIQRHSNQRTTISYGGYISHITPPQ